MVLMTRRVSCYDFPTSTSDISAVPDTEMVLMLLGSVSKTHVNQH